MLDKPRIVEFEAQQVAAIRLLVPRAEIRNVMGPGLAELAAVLAAQGIAPAGPWLTHHFRNPGDTFDFEICIPVAETVTPSGRVKPSELPAGTVARAIYRGPYEGLGAAWGEFGAWIEAQGHVPSVELWECYLAGPETGPDSSTWQTELNRPINVMAQVE